MASRPTTTPTWGGTQTEPSSGQKSAGFAAGDRPPASWFNWLLDNLADWINYLDTEKLPDVEQASASTSVFGTPSRPNEHPGSASNRWKEIISARTNLATSTRVRLLVGDGDSDGTWAITFNARWQCASGDQNWVSDNTAVDSAMVIASPDGLIQVQRRAAGGGSWTSWTNANLSAKDIAASGNVGVTGNVLVTGGVASDDVIAADLGFYTPGSTGDFNYAPTKLRAASMLQVGDAVGDTFRNATNGSIGSGGGTVGFPVRVSESFGGGTIEVAYYQNAASGATFRLVSRAINFATGAVVRSVVDSFTGPAASGTQVGSLAMGFAPDPDTDYQIEFVRADALDEVNGFRMVSWTDGGPRPVF
jgi:hypothetical protein